MKAIILSAGQGKRCLPLTSETPKCLLPVDLDHTILTWQISVLTAAGITECVVVSGFEAGRIDEELARKRLSSARTIYNPFYDVSDNLASVWCALPEATEDFLLINGDTLFAPATVRRLLASHATITVTISQKARYDADDMKVRVSDELVCQIGKHLNPTCADGEAIGMTLFRGSGRDCFAETVYRSLRRPGGRDLWYPAALDELARGDGLTVSHCSTDAWCEVDVPSDLQQARQAVQRWRSTGAPHLAAVS
ncbi:NTP transferase domain-containing protein [Rhodovibrio salinarum]|uniref:MobA-like NTP transferase domain-containing protein n=1 Tax=Rhodovibrio salinarum TaxID=1087 RepID=A0A934V280_9PROT|nr:phosphocholine cytidylyltransferase family protein [Rhodovibrio salinarum]MBK1699223.1 hypothetical protein [Rhodovibrio salinarum]